MKPSILLLDCRPELEEALKKQGYDVMSGKSGFVKGTRVLPCQIYERNIIIFDPTSPTQKLMLTDFIVKSNNKTPEYKITDVVAHVNRGAIILAFLKDLPVSDKLGFPYQWIPAMPDLSSTKDTIVNPANLSGIWLQSIVGRNFLKIPTVVKLIHSGGRVLYSNENKESLGLEFSFGSGKVVLLPDSEDNEKVINAFLHRALPKLWDYESQQQLIDKFTSPEEEKLQEKLKKAEVDRDKIEEEISALTENLVSAQLNKTQTIKQDETATLILNYFDLALQQSDVALFYIYKVTETLEKKYGSEKIAKETLERNTEWNLIGKLANASYADVRHAPNPGEKIKEWTDEEIKSCFDAAGKIISSYFLTLF